MLWNYTQPVGIRFGKGRVGEIADVAGENEWRRGVLVAGHHCVSSGLTQQLVDDSDGVIVGVFSDFSPNPDVTEADACAQLLRESGADFVVALGGGSALDVAKAAASVCTLSSEHSTADFHATGVPLPGSHLPVVAIPTTAGTGSEVTCVSVLSDRALGKKAPIVSENFFPTVAIIDPELTYSVPPHVSASTGMDVLSQAIEGFWSKGHQPVCDSCAVHAASLAFRYLPKVVANPQDALAREKMCEASLIAGLAFALPKTTSSHACSFPLTNLYGIDHGEACGLTLDYFARINADAQGGRIQEFSRQLGFADVEAMARGIHDLKVATGLRTSLADLNLSNAQIENLVRLSRHPNLNNNPVEITDEMLEAMYRHLCTEEA